MALAKLTESQSSSEGERPARYTAKVTTNRPTPRASASQVERSAANDLARVGCHTRGVRFRAASLLSSPQSSAIGTVAKTVPGSLSHHHSWLRGWPRVKL